MATPFVGRHNQILGELIELLERIKSGDQTAPRVVVLRGESGIGKTRIMRELYNQLRTDEHPHFWPELEEGDHPLQTRKDIGPDLIGEEFNWPANALPTFSWWSFACNKVSDRLNNTVVGTVENVTKDFWMPYAIAKYQSLDLGEKIKATTIPWGRRLSDLVKEGLSEQAKELVTELVTSVIPFAGPLLSLGEFFLEDAKEKYAQRKALKSENTLGHTLENDARKFAHVVKDFAAPEFPAIVVVEDAHFMNADLAAFLDELSKADPRKPTLTIITAWPESENHESPSKQWMQWLATHELKSAVQVIDVPRLTEVDLATILQVYAPEMPLIKGMNIAQKFKTPLEVSLFMTSGRVVAEIENGCLDNIEKLTEQFPNRLAEVYEGRWKALDENTRAALKAAVSIVHLDPEESEFIDEVVSGAMSYIPDNKFDIKRGLETAKDPARWLASRGNLCSFKEEKLKEVALREDHYFPYNDDGKLEELRKAKFRALRNFILTRSEEQDLRLSLTDEAATFAAHKLLAEITPEGAQLPRIEEHADRAAVWLVARVKYQGFKYKDAIALYELLLNSLDKDHENRIDIRRDHFFAVRDGGDGFRALGLIKKLWEDCEKLYGEDSEENALWEQYLHADCLEQVGHLEEAKTAFESLLVNEIREYTKDHKEVRETEDRLCGLMGQMGQVEEAVERYQARLQGFTETGEEWHEASLIVREDLAWFLMESGRNEEALEHYVELIETLSELYGPDDPWTLEVRNDCAYCLGVARFEEQALALATEVVDDAVEAMGFAHPKTLVYVNNKAWWLGRTGRIDEAIELLEEVVEEGIRQRGEDMPKTLESRDDLAWWIGESGERARAVHEFRDIYSRRRKVLGTKHPDTILTKSNIAWQYGQMGDFTAAFQLQEEVIRERQAQMPETHPHLMEARHDLAVWYAQSGRKREARDLLELVLRQRSEVHGAEDKRTEETREALRLLDIPGGYEQVEDTAWKPEEEYTPPADEIQKITIPDNASAIELARILVAGGLEDSAISNEHLVRGISIEAADLQSQFLRDESSARANLADVMAYCYLLAENLGVKPEELIRERLKGTIVD